MGVAAQQKIESGMGGLAIDLGGVREEDREFTLRDLRARLLDIVDPEIMRVIDAREMEFTVGWTLLPPERPEEAEPRPAVPPVARWRRSVTVEGRRTEILETSLVKSCFTCIR